MPLPSYYFPLLYNWISIFWTLRKIISGSLWNFHSCFICYWFCQKVFFPQYFLLFFMILRISFVDQSAEFTMLFVTQDVSQHFSAVDSIEFFIWFYLFFTSVLTRSFYINSFNSMWRFCLHVSTLGLWSFIFCFTDSFPLVSVHSSLRGWWVALLLCLSLFIIFLKIYLYPPLLLIVFFWPHIFSLVFVSLFGVTIRSTLLATHSLLFTPAA